MTGPDDGVDHDPSPPSGDRRVFFVLGMHRSGTSCLMACLEQCGVEVGSVLRHTMNQPRGNMERLSVIELNNRLLERGGARWDQPPQREVQPLAEDVDAIRAVLEELQTSGPGALKDPRLVLTHSAWLPLADDPVVVGTFRHPNAVARSLGERDRMPAHDAYRLWNDYNERLIDLHEELGFPLIEFDLSDDERYCSIVASLAAEHGLLPRRLGLRRVVEARHTRNSVAADSEVPSECARTYRYLRERRYAGVLEPDGAAARLVAEGADLGERAPSGIGDRAERWARRATRRLPSGLRRLVSPLWRFWSHVGPPQERTLTHRSTRRTARR